MFKGQSKSPTKSPTKSPSKYSKATANELALLISRMQKNADQVERNVLETHQKLKQDAGNYALKKSFEHQQENAKNLKESELLLKDLFLDVDKAKKYGHPQAEEIDKDIRQLHERLSAECAEYREVYEKYSIAPPEPKVNWPQILDSKKKQLDVGQYGPSLADVERQIAEHNILQREIDEYGTDIRNLPQENASIKNQYRSLQEDSAWRGRNLSSLYNHLHGCTKELMYLSDEQNKIIKQDWSDQIPDLPGTRRQYEVNAIRGKERTGYTCKRRFQDCRRVVRLKIDSEKYGKVRYNSWERLVRTAVLRNPDLGRRKSKKKVTAEKNYAEEACHNTSDSENSSIHHRHGNGQSKTMYKHVMRNYYSKGKYVRNMSSVSSEDISSVISSMESVSDKELKTKKVKQNRDVDNTKRKLLHTKRDSASIDNQPQRGQCSTVAGPSHASVVTNDCNRIGKTFTTVKTFTSVNSPKKKKKHADANVPCKGNYSKKKNDSYVTSMGISDIRDRNLVEYGATSESECSRNYDDDILTACEDAGLNCTFQDSNDSPGSGNDSTGHAVDLSCARSNVSIPEGQYVTDTRKYPSHNLDCDGSLTEMYQQVSDISDQNYRLQTAILSRQKKIEQNQEKILLILQKSDPKNTMFRNTKKAITTKKGK